MNKLAAHYDPPKPNNLRELKTVLGERDAHGVKITLITDVLECGHLAEKDDAGKWRAAFIHDDAADTWNLVDGVDINSVIYADNPLIRKRPLPDLFDPVTGAWRDNVRTPTSKTAEQELRESMLAVGFLPDEPILRDENGVIIKGHRREAMALALQAEFPDRTDLAPVYVTRKLTLEDKVALAVFSNRGAEGYSPADKKAIAQKLYEGLNWKPEKIAEKLKLSRATIYRYLDANFSDEKFGDKPKPGRPRKGKKPDPGPKPDPEPEPVELDDDDPEPGPLTQDAVDRDLAETPPLPSDFTAAASGFTLFDFGDSPTVEAKPAPLVANTFMTKFANAATQLQKKAIYLTVLCQRKEFASNLADVSAHRDYIAWLRETFAATHNTLLDLLARMPEQPPLPFEGH